MADVGKIEGPSGPPENLGKKDKTSIDADKFKQEMRRRVSEVSKTDPDEQKKRKRREESEEEEGVTPPAQNPATPPDQVTPFSLEQEKKKVSPLEMQKEGLGTPPLKSAQTTPLQKGALYQSPSSTEMQDDSGLLEEESFTEEIPLKSAPHPGFGAQAPSLPSEQNIPSSTPQQQAPSFQPPPTPTSQPSSPSTQPLEVGPPESISQPTREEQQQVSPQSPSPEKSPQPTLRPLSRKTAEEVKKEQQKKNAALQPKPLQKKEKGYSATSLEGATLEKSEETAAFFEQMGKEGQGQDQGQQPPMKKTEEELEEEAQAQGIGGSGPTPFAQSLEGQEEKKLEKKQKGSELIPQELPISSSEMPSVASPPPLESLPPYANLSPQVMELFDRMVGVMTVMNMTGMTETTITLNAPQFASSVFFGTQIIIQEFSTAPKAFNIQLNGNSQAIALIQGNADDLMAAFQAGNYNFRVNRLETGYLSERPLFKRKEKAGGKDQDQTGENPQ